MPEKSPTEVVLCLNSGSSSLKFALFRVTANGEEPLANGAIEQLGSAQAKATLKIAEQTRERDCANADMTQALGVAFELLEAEALPRPALVGHRVVHGGREHLAHTRIDAALLQSLKALVPLAPLHQPAALAAIEAALARLPDLPQVACFDTAFHAQLPEYAARLPLPHQLYAEGVRRYGFHGLSYEYIVASLGSPTPMRLIIAHLGSGASLCAIKDGRSIDTTMGFTPGGGIMMGTRTGDLDPGLLFYLMRAHDYSVDALERLVTRESGLRGVAGSADMRALVERRGADERAGLAITMLGYAVRKAIGGYMAVLGGLDTLVFTGGIGEHTAAIREQACLGLAPLGVVLNAVKNERGERAIHAPDSTSQVLVLETDEDRMIARHTYAVCAGV